MFKILKQELLFLPIMMVVLEMLRWCLMRYFPETALFDRGSELETFLFSFWQITWISSSTLILMRIISPSHFYSLKEYYYNFKNKPSEDRYKASTRFYLALFFGLIWLVSGRAATPEGALRKKLLDTLHTQLNVREATGKNDGLEVEKYLTYVGRFKGDAWCAAFASWNLHAVGITAPPNPKSGWSPNFSTPLYTVWSSDLVKKHKAKKVNPGDCFTLYYPSIGRVGHVGFIVDQTDSYFITIEGNTGLTGSREGSGVHKYKRQKSKVYRVTNYITPYIDHYAQTNLSGCDSHHSGRMSQENCENPGKKYRDPIANSYRKGFCGSKRSTASCTSRQLPDRSASFYPFRTGLSSGNDVKLFKVTGEGVCKREQTHCEMPLSRFGEKGSGPGAHYQEAFIAKFAKTEYKVYPRNKGSALFTALGENT